MTAAVAARIGVWGSTSRHGGVSSSTRVVAVSVGTLVAVWVAVVLGAGGWG